MKSIEAIIRQEMIKELENRKLNPTVFLWEGWEIDALIFLVNKKKEIIFLEDDP